MQALAISRRESSERRAELLGLFSLALGISQLVAPGRLARLIGLKDSSSVRNVMRAVGAREVVSGLGLLARRSAGPLWARVAGDVVDLTLLGAAMTNGVKSRARLSAATAAVAGIAAVDTLSAARLSRSGKAQDLVKPIHVVRSITIGAPPSVVYEFWRDLVNLPRFMAHLEEVREEGVASYWRAKGPAGSSIEWRAEITLDEPGRCIAWRSVEGALVPNRGVVRFSPAPGDRGTEVLVELKYEPPGGAIGAAFAKLFGEEPGQQISGDLRRLKQVLETGSIAHSDASIHRFMHAARPPSADETPIVLGRSEV